MDKGYYFRVLYPLQDRVIGILSGLETGFYLTGGTAASRGYLNHRFSDDLDFFVNDDARFVLWAERLIQSLSRVPGWRLDVTLKEERFVRVGIRDGETLLKVEMINDVPARSGEIREHPVLGRALCSATTSDWELIRWIEAPDVERFKADLDRLGESLILG